MTIITTPGGAPAVGLTDAERDAAIEYFAAKLRYETDPSDVVAALVAGEDFVLVDTRGPSSWHQGRLSAAVHIPRAEIAERALAEIPVGTAVVVYCWGPACNGATRSAIEFLKLGYTVREMIGGFEYWARAGLDVVDDHGAVDFPLDALTAPKDSISCDC
jgi:rhodanese-related sulfurtransferase